jgi:hypothetical protein
MGLWKMLRCKHLNVRCVHGEEILATGARRACTDCHRYLRGPLPEVCTFTGLRHGSAGDSSS